LLALGIWGVVHGTIRLVLTIADSGGWVSGLIGVVTIILGMILAINWANPDWSLALLYIGASMLIVVGFILINRAFRQNPAAYSNII
jgi:uncharacterized membrane protein HdeD (DUF308 family)